MTGNKQPIEPRKKTSFTAYLWVVLGIIYAISPLDILPDIPGIGWIDDVFILAATWLNLFEQQADNGNETLSKVFKYVKWGVIGIGVVVVLLILLLGATIVNIFSK